MAESYGDDEGGPVEVILPRLDLSRTKPYDDSQGKYPRGTNPKSPGRSSANAPRKKPKGKGGTMKIERKLLVVNGEIVGYDEEVVYTNSPRPKKSKSKGSTQTSKTPEYLQNLPNRFRTQEQQDKEQMRAEAKALKEEKSPYSQIPELPYIQQPAGPTAQAPKRKYLPHRLKVPPISASSAEAAEGAEAGLARRRRGKSRKAALGRSALDQAEPPRTPGGEADARGARVKAKNMGPRLWHNPIPTAPKSPDTSKKLSRLRELIGLPEWNGEGSSEFYKLGPVLGQGAFAKVSIAWHRLTGHQVAIKRYNLAALMRDSRLYQSVVKEIRMLSAASHKGIVHCYEAFRTRSAIHVVLEYLGGGSLYCVLKKARSMKRPYMTEPAARAIFRPIARGLVHLHLKGIVHRDIKLQNVMLTTHGVPKLSDLGFATTAADKGKGEEGTADTGLSFFCGTVPYMAPEIFERAYGRGVDVWALGVTLYLMLVGQYPFWDNNDEVLKKKIRAMRFPLPDHLSQDAKHLLSHMLCPLPQRFTSMEVAGHAWVRSGMSADDVGGSQGLGVSMDDTDGTGLESLSVDQQNEISAKVLKKMERQGFDMEMVDAMINEPGNGLRNQVTMTHKILMEEATAKL